MPVLQINHLINAAREISPFSLEILALAEKTIVSRKKGFKGLAYTEKAFQDLKKELEDETLRYFMNFVSESQNLNEWRINHESMKNYLFKYDLTLSSKQQQELYFEQAKLYAKEAIFNISSETFNELNQRLESLYDILVRSNIIVKSDLRITNNPNFNAVGLTKDTLEFLIKKAKENSFKKIEHEYLPKFNSSLRKQTVINSLINKLSDSELSIQYWLDHTSASIENKDLVKQYSA